MPTTSPEHDARIATLTFAGVYPHYVTKVEKKGRTVAELHQVIAWLTGFDETMIQKCSMKKSLFKSFSSGQSYTQMQNL